MRLIDADKLKKAIDKEFEKADLTDYEACSCVCEIYDKCIDNAPTIIWCSETSEGLPLMDLRPRPQGKWKRIYEEDNDVECPFCGFQEDGIYYNFCPNCGAQMDGGESWRSR